MKYNKVKRDLFIAAMQVILGGSENARRDLIRLQRYATSHHRQTINEDKEGIRKTERLIRHLLVKWYSVAAFRTKAALPELDYPTVLITTPDGTTSNVPFQWDRATKRQYYECEKSNERRALASRLSGGKATQKDG